MAGVAPPVEVGVGADWEVGLAVVVGFNVVAYLGLGGATYGRGGDISGRTVGQVSS